MEKKWLSEAEQEELQMILAVEYASGFSERGIAEKVVKREYSLLETLDIAKALKAQIDKDGASVIVSRVFGNDKLILNFNESWMSIHMVDKNEKDPNDTKSPFYFSKRNDLYSVYYTPKYWVAIVSYPFIICINRKCLDIQLLWPYTRT